MSILGKLHELSFYGLLSTIVSIVFKKININILIDKATHVYCFTDFFISFLFWATVLFIPISVVSAFSTKYADFGEGLSFSSNNIIVIMFAHIAEEILGLFCTPIWFLRDVFTRELNLEKVIDYSIYVIELIFLVLGFLLLFKVI